MSRHTIVVVGLALVCGLAAAIGVNTYWGSQGRSADAIQVVVAVEDIPTSTEITAKMVAIQWRSKEQVPPGSCSRLEDVVKYFADCPLAKNETILESRVKASLVPKGMREFQIPQSTPNLPNFRSNRDKVDVHLIPSGPGGKEVVLQNVSILLRKDKTKEKDKQDRVSVLVTAAQAHELTREGKFHLVLRNPEDDSSLETTTVRTVADNKVMPAVAPPSVPLGLNVMKGADTKKFEFAP